MIEDKLYRDERLRLECIAQAIQHAANHRAHHATVEEIIADAQKIEGYVR